MWIVPGPGLDLRSYLRELQRRSHVKRGLIRVLICPSRVKEVSICKAVHQTRNFCQYRTRFESTSQTFERTRAMSSSVVESLVTH